MRTCVRLHIKGIVQGVGFRPFVYSQAKKHLICGWVLNATDGVHVEAEGEEEHVNAFVMALSEKAPAAAKVSEINIEEIPLQHFDSFEIRTSDDNVVSDITLVSPDLAICDDCMRELFDETDRRYHYPFINCTNCGPRFTIIDSLPYDRAKTSMAEFPMCDSCSCEYKDPSNRRFHAQPNACFDCGPSLWLYRFENVAERKGIRDQGIGKLGNREQGLGISNGKQLENSTNPYSLVPNPSQELSDKLISEAAKFLSDGKILAVKGLGGYHLVCNAKNEDALNQLRDAKHRDNKAFAVMVKNAEIASHYCMVSDIERDVLKTPAKPIVLLKKKPGISFQQDLSGNLPELGVMLPYTPVQALLLAEFEKVSDIEDAMLVMTSGNLHDEPIVMDDEEAVTKFEGVADAILGNNRKILTRFDDSVVRVLDFGDNQTAIQMVRRARGYAPRPLEIPLQHKGELFATGPEQKNTFAYVRDNQAFISQHIGDVENAEVQDAWFEAKSRYEKLFALGDTCEIVCDKHPEYLTSKWAFKHVSEAEKALPFEEVYHHHAHIVTAMAENALDEPCIGFAFDGTGFGADGCIWGGEVLLCNYETFERVANFAYFPLPGGAQAVKEPIRSAYGLLYAYDLLDEYDLKGIRDQGLGISKTPAIGETTNPYSLVPSPLDCKAIIEEGINTPYTSSVGRLFDAVSALLGICTHPTYEGEAAIALEAVMSDTAMSSAYDSQADRYTFDVQKNSATEHSTALDTSMFIIDAEKVLRAIAEDIKAGVKNAIVARRFHDALVRLVVLISQLTFQIYGIKKVVLSGGVWMNRYLVENTVKSLQNEGFDVVLNNDLPPNDGGVSYGQAVVAVMRKLAKTKEGE